MSKKSITLEDLKVTAYRSAFSFLCVKVEIEISVKNVDHNALQAPL